MDISPIRPNRGDTIRTCDLLLPKQALYQAELRPGQVEYSSVFRPKARHHPISTGGSSSGGRERPLRQTSGAFELLVANRPG